MPSQGGAYKRRAPTRTRAAAANALDSHPALDALDQQLNHTRAVARDDDDDDDDE